MPVEGRILLDIVEAVFAEQAHYPAGQHRVNVDWVVLPVGSGDSVHRVRLRGYADVVIELLPVGADENEAFNAVGGGFSAELLRGQY